MGGPALDPLYKDHLTIKTTLGAAQRWSLYQGSTVHAWKFIYTQTLIYVINQILVNIKCSFRNDAKFQNEIEWHVPWIYGIIY